MNKILELREKRAKAWDAAKAFLDTKRGTDGLISAENEATYNKMEADVVALGKEIDRLEKQAILDAELNAPMANPLTGSLLLQNWRQNRRAPTSTALILECHAFQSSNAGNDECACKLEPTPKVATLFLTNMSTPC